MADARVIRFDDVCIRSDLSRYKEMALWLMERGWGVWYCVSPLVHGDAEGERVFPKVLSARSDHRNFYRVDQCGLPEDQAIPYGVKLASHGLLHVDHRLLMYEAQELSIVTSCSLIGTKVFVPPFNKWNSVTQSVCLSHDIHLVKFEAGWRGMEHEPFDPDHSLWYCHPRHWTVEKLEAYLCPAQ